MSHLDALNKEDKNLFELQVEIPKLQLSMKMDHICYLASLGRIELSSKARTLQSEAVFSVASFQVVANEKAASHTLVSNERPQGSKVQGSDLHNSEMFRFSVSENKQGHQYFLVPGSKRNIEVAFNTLYVSWKPLLMNEVILFAIDEINEIKKEQMAKYSDARLAAPKDDALLRQKKIKELHNALQNRKLVNLRSTNITVVGLFIAFYTPQTDIQLTSVTLNNLSMMVSTSIEKQVFKGRLENLVISDHTNYPNTVVSAEEQKFEAPTELFGVNKFSKSILEFTMVMYPDYHPQLVDSRTLLINLDVNSIVINYMQQPFLRIISYLKRCIFDVYSKQPVLTIPKTIQQIKEMLKDPKFMKLDAVIKNLKVKLSTHSLLSHLFELDFQQIGVSNEIVKHKKRIQSESKAFSYTFNENFKFSFKRIVLSKVSREGQKRLQITNEFDIALDLERSLFKKEYLRLLADEYKENQKYNFDGKDKINLHIKEFELKVKRQDYVELLDTLANSVLFRDQKDYIYSFNKGPPKENPAGNFFHYHYHLINYYSFSTGTSKHSVRCNHDIALG